MLPGKAHARLTLQPVLLRSGVQESDGSRRSQFPSRIVETKIAAAIAYWLLHDNSKDLPTAIGVPHREPSSLISDF